MEFTRRWGAFAGILVSNLLYTFVQHYDYFGSAASLAVPMFAGVFAIGLLFAMVFWRSGKLVDRRCDACVRQCVHRHHLWQNPLTSRTSGARIGATKQT